MRPLNLLLSILPLLQSCSANEPKPVPHEATQDVFDLGEFNRIGKEINGRVAEAKSSGNLLTVILELRKLEKEYSQQGSLASQVLDTIMMGYAAEIGDYAGALRHADRGAGASQASKLATLQRLEGYAPQNALAGIVSSARQTQLVMINEAHHVPQHRAFTLLLLRELKGLGFTHFAAEALSAGDPQLKQRGYPTTNSGTYIEEPVFADLVRTAIELGYRIVPYEPASFGGDRELAQAKNLIQRTLDLDPDARILVHAGYQHIDEKGSISGSVALAGRLKLMTGIDPLTIDQTAMSEHSSAQYEHAAYGDVLERYAIVVPTIFRSEQGVPFTLSPGVRDITLVHPRSVYERGRPNWLTMNGLRKRVALPNDLCAGEPRVLVRAMLQSESESAIPMDQVEAIAGEEVPNLVLPEGKYRIEVQDRHGKLMRESERVVQ